MNLILFSRQKKVLNFINPATGESIFKKKNGDAPAATTPAAAAPAAPAPAAQPPAAAAVAQEPPTVAVVNNNEMKAPESASQVKLFLLTG